MAECDRSLATPVCTGSLLTATQYDSSVAIAEVEAGNMPARIVIFLCEYSSLSSPLSIGFLFHLIIPLPTCTSIHCTLFHVLYYG